jgi:hypothetical protein
MYFPKPEEAAAMNQTGVGAIVETCRISRIEDVVA